MHIGKKLTEFVITPEPIILPAMEPLEVPLLKVPEPVKERECELEKEYA